MSKDTMQPILDALNNINLDNEDAGSFCCYFFSKNKVHPMSQVKDLAELSYDHIVKKELILEYVFDAKLARFAVKQMAKNMGEGEMSTFEEHLKLVLSLVDVVKQLPPNQNNVCTDILRVLNSHAIFDSSNIQSILPIKQSFAIEILLNKAKELVDNAIIIMADDKGLHQPSP